MMQHVDGLHYATAEPVRISWEHGVISAIEPLPRRTEGLVRWVAPSLFDVQINGYGGVDFQQDDLSLEALLKASRALRRDGCARFFFTLITAEWEALLARIRRAKALRSASSELQASIAGWHIEGPFLSDKPGFCGAHDPTVMLDPTERHIDELRAATAGDPVLLTVAPERHGAIRAIEKAVSLGMTVSLGHSDASADVLLGAAKAGATGYTHLANGCPRELDRHDNIVWRVCDLARLHTSLIPDGIHVSPAPFRALHKLLPTVYYTTDAMAAAGAPAGRYTIGRIEVEVGADQVVRQPGRTNFAGSALRPVDAVERAARMLNAPWRECWKRLSEAPACLVGLEHRLKPGGPAFICSIFEAPDGRLTVENLF